MVHRWRCRHCDLTAWSGSSSQLERKVKSHLFDHHRDNVSKVDFRVKWNCPYCVIAEQTHDKQEAVTQFQDHLYGHEEDNVDSGVHVADDINRRGNVLVKGPVESPGSDNARVHFLSSGDIMVLVTSNPRARIELLHENLNEWPDWTVIITTKRRPLNEPMDIDFTDIPIELVKLDQSLGPTGLGETISRVIAEHEAPGKQFSFGFDILSEVIAKFDLERSVKFVKMLSSRLAETGGLSHFYIDPGPQSSTVLNVIDDRFDLELETDGQIFTSMTRPSHSADSDPLGSS